MPTTYNLEAKIYTIHDRPLDKLPIRRLQSEGAEALEVNELLQIALGRVDGFEQLVNEYGIQFLTTLHSVNDIVEVLKLDHIQATRLLAMLALGKKLYARPQDPLTRIRGIDDVYAHYQAVGALSREQLRVLILNSRYQVIHEDILAIGTVDTTQISPVNVLQPAVARGMGAIILVHNHPSGECSPSQADIDFTHTIQEAGKLLGVQLLDHVIIGQDCYQSVIPNSQT